MTPEPKKDQENFEHINIRNNQLKGSVVIPPSSWVKQKGTLIRPEYASQSPLEQIQEHSKARD